MEFFLIILLIVFIFLVAKSIDEKTNRITSKVTPLIITMILRITYMIMKQIKLFLLLMSGKRMALYLWSAVFIVRGKQKMYQKFICL